ncbi:hypothetical protein F0L68_12060 [Solihabitans fulvus]|uniref:DUF306 domain-containing protein n=1 Tax=Solihabitans fulvus TaxID=1892852 RepID=A0A5B2XIL1_9PSEU|nr:hypothetical protein [Solihabitans fulvus]KAA2262630.1 hypothetical protein F0L68_12060 [Solihabitans fulvus]
MSDELEQLVRGTLRRQAAEITQDSLRHHDIRPVRRSRVAPVLLVLACVVAVAVGSVLIYQGHTASPLGTPPGYVGYQWRLTEVATGEANTVVSQDIRATASFFPDGTVVLVDSVNALTGRYDGTATGFGVRGIGTTLALYDGRDPVRLAVVTAVDDLASGQHVDAAVLGETLTLRAAGRTLTFQQVGPVHPSDLRPGPSR